MPRGTRKENLPEKTCATCGRPFTWRRKWARDWDQVRYCSVRCRAGKPGAAADRPASGAGTVSAGQKNLQARR